MRLVPRCRVLVSPSRILRELYRPTNERFRRGAGRAGDPARAYAPLGAYGTHGLRGRLAYDPGLTTVVLRQLIAAVSAWLRGRARRLGIRGAIKTGAVTVIQRFNSALDVSPHFHVLFMDRCLQLPGRAKAYLLSHVRAARRGRRAR